MPYIDEKGNLVLTNRDCVLAYMPEIPALETENENLKIQNSSLLDQINKLKDDKCLKKYFVCSECISNSKINFVGIIESKEKEILNLQAKLKGSESINSSSNWSKKESMQRELDELRRRANIACETFDGLRKMNSQIFAERNSLKDKVFSLVLKCVKLSQQVSDFEKVIILERDKDEKEKKIAEQKNVNKDFSKEKKVLETEIAKLTRKLSELSTNILKEKKTKSELHKKFDLIAKERNSLSSKIKELEEVVFKVKLTEHKTPESIAQSSRDDLADSEGSLKTASISHFSNVSNNPLFCEIDDHTSEHKDQIRPSNIFYEKDVDGLGNFKKNESQKKRFWRREDEKDRGHWIWRVKESSEEKKEEKSFVHTFNAQRNNAPKGKTFGKPDLVYTINQLIRTATNPLGPKYQWVPKAKSVLQAPKV
ncbi:hypothetical protein L6452_39007 [Arctium lappa]|uniref:Uncharacterized protein n=1 Tax=Arctium lappa TaxID=4217 RepID=A0ACB8XR46_ARCLA|nr:hypothetical protein L6452_39007 [Arctium lappa]